MGAKINAYGPMCRISSVNGGKFEMYVSIGITNAAVFPEPMHFFLSSIISVYS